MFVCWVISWASGLGVVCWRRVNRKEYCQRRLSRLALVGRVGVFLLLGFVETGFEVGATGFEGRAG
jgi:hypothetical protein